MSWPDYLNVKDHGHDDTDRLAGALYTTGSVAFKFGYLFLLCWSARGSSTTPAVPTITKHTGGATANATSITSVNNAGTNMRTGMFRLMPAKGADFTDALDIAFNVDALGAGWIILEIPLVDASGSNGSGAVVQPNTGTIASATSISPTLSGGLGKASNIMVAVVKHDNVNAGSFSVGATDQSEPSGGAPAYELCAGHLTPGGTSMTASWSGSTNGAWVACEVKTLDSQANVAVAV